MNSNRHLYKLVASDMGGNPTLEASRLKAINAEAAISKGTGAAELPEQLLMEEAQPSDLYLDQPPEPKKHSADFIVNRRKVRQIAAPLPQLSEQLSKLADQLRYYDPLIAEVLDDACNATEEALILMQQE